jgi:hypothetical protein
MVHVMIIKGSEFENNGNKLSDTIGITGGHP